MEWRCDKIRLIFILSYLRLFAPQIVSSVTSLRSVATRRTQDSLSTNDFDDEGMRHGQTSVGIYKGNLVAIRMIAAVPKVITRENLLELKMVWTRSGN